MFEPLLVPYKRRTFPIPTPASTVRRLHMLEREALYTQERVERSDVLLNEVHKAGKLLMHGPKYGTVQLSTTHKVSHLCEVLSVVPRTHTFMLKLIRCIHSHKIFKLVQGAQIQEGCPNSKIQLKQRYSNSHRVPGLVQGT